MNNLAEVQIPIGTPLDLAIPALKAIPIPEQCVPAFEQLGLIPFDPDMWDLWSD